MNPERRALLGLAVALAAPTLRAHHGWKPYEAGWPLYLEGPVAVISWADPHPYMEVLHRTGTRVPEDLRRRVYAPTRAPLDLDPLFNRLAVPAGYERRWRVDLPSLARLASWGFPRPKVDEVLGVIGHAGPPVTGTPVLQAELVFIGGKGYPVNQEPA